MVMVKEIVYLISQQTVKMQHVFDLSKKGDFPFDLLKIVQHRWFMDHINLTVNFRER